VAEREPTPGGVVASPFPRLVRLRVRIPLRSDEWTIWPAQPETKRDFVVGFPLELHPFAWDYLHIASDGASVRIEPHYRESSFDMFRVDTRGHVTCHALGGLFPFTLGRQPELLEGLRVTVLGLPRLVAPSNPAAAITLQSLAERLAAILLELRKVPEEELHRELDLHVQRHRATVGGRLAHALWRRKLPRAARARSS
jgi:hypothetical protein